MRVRHLAPSFAVLALACASRGPLPPGDELEDPPEAPIVRDARGNARIPTDRQPTTDELDRAFEAAGTEGEARPRPGLTGGHPVEAPPEAVDPLAEREAAFESDAAEVHALLARKSPDVAAAADRLVGGAQGLSPRHAQRALRLRLQAAKLEKDERGAKAASWRLLLACGPADADKCRREALAEAERAKVGPKVAEARRHDGCLKSAEAAARRKGAPLPSCLDAAQGFYRGQNDRLMGARALLARAEAKLRAEAPEARRELERAAQYCAEPRCLELRRRALQRLCGAQLAAQEPEAAARSALAEMQLFAQTLRPAERAWAWTEEAERACRALDAASGEGTCRRLERRLFGRHAFRDFSRPPSRGEGLSPEQVRTVNAHYRPSFEQCLAEEAIRLRPPAQEQYTVRWVVGNDGRVTRMQMDRPAQEQGALAGCLREQLALWRYPRFHGELQHVEQSFGVSAAVRR